MHPKRQTAQSATQKCAAQPPRPRRETSTHIDIVIIRMRRIRWKSSETVLDQGFLAVIRYSEDEKSETEETERKQNHRCPIQSLVLCVSASLRLCGESTSPAGT